MKVNVISDIYFVSFHRVLGSDAAYRHRIILPLFFFSAFIPFSPRISHLLIARRRILDLPFLAT